MIEKIFSAENPSPAFAEAASRSRSPLYTKEG
jgi:hypothetical protein